MLAKSLAYTKDGKTLNITIVPNAKWSNGKPVTAADVAYSLTIGKQDKAADQIGLTRPRAATSSVSVTGARSVAIKFKAVDSTFVGSQLANVPIVPKAIWSKVKNIMDFTNPNPVGSGPFNRITRFNGQDYVLSKNQQLLQGGPAEDPVHRADRRRVERRRTAPDRQRRGRLDAQLRAERRVRLPGEGSDALPQRVPDDGACRSASSST